MNSLSDILAKAEALKHSIMMFEPSKMKRMEFCLQLSSLIRHYNELHNTKVNKHKQVLMTRFLRQAPAQPQPQPQPDVESVPGPSTAQ